MFAGKRVAVAIAAMLGVAAASAADYRIGPAPAWVRPVAFDAAVPAQSDTANVAFGARYDLIDDQVRLAPGSRTRFHHVVSEAVTAKGIDDLSHREIEVDPGWETLVISQLDVIRDGRRASRLRDMQVKVLQRERDLESRIYDGRKMIALDLPDIRVGDIVEFAYTRSGMNPVFQGHHAGDFDMQWQVPVAQLHRRLSSAVGLNLQVRQLTGAAAPQAVARADGFDERTWDLRNVPGLRVEASVPGNFNPYPWIEWSDFASWGEVARWAERLYPVPARLSPALQAAVDGIARQSPDADARVVAVLRLVQQQVRYLGVEIGAGTHAPSAPDVVYARRWGDCKEKSLLMVTMLRALGVDASPALVNTERRHDIEHDLPNAGSFDHAIVHVKFNGQDDWLDPTRAPQQGTLSTVSQPDYARALVLDGRSAALTAMRANTVAAHAREVQVEVDSRAGFDQPVKYDVRTTYRGFSADMMRDELGDGAREDLQHRYLNFYAGSYAGIRVAAPFEVQDDTRANTVVVTEHYLVKDFWPADGQGARQASLHVPEIDNELRAPEETIRTMPLSLHGPQSVREALRVRLPQAWPDRKLARSVVNPAFRLDKSLTIRGDVLTADYLLEIAKDQVDAAAVPQLASDIDKAQGLLGDRVSTAHDGAAASAGRWAPAIAGLVAALAVFWLRRRRAPRDTAPNGDAAQAEADRGPDTAANDSRQPLAA